jgi:hypothetical protein
VEAIIDIKKQKEQPQPKAKLKPAPAPEREPEPEPEPESEEEILSVWIHQAWKSVKTIQNLTWISKYNSKSHLDWNLYGTTDIFFKIRTSNILNITGCKYYKLTSYINTSI